MLNRLFRSENSFLKIILLLISISVFHLTAIWLDSGFPLALLYGPVLYYAHLRLKGSRPGKSVLCFLFSCFIGVSGWYVVLKINQVSIDELVKTYYLVYYVLFAFSLFIFPILIFKQKNKWIKPVSFLKSAIIYQLSTISIIISFTTSLLILKRWYDLELDVNPTYMIYMLMLLMVVLLGRYIYQDLSWEREAEKAIKLPRGKIRLDGNHSLHYSLPEGLLRDYAQRLQDSLLVEKLYLRHGLSIELLAQETNIPKHHLSELLNAYLGKSFYQLIAEYRIQDAKSKLEDRRYNMTIETLAYESGFNSKTSFNKYFKEVTGISPSEYRDQLASL